MIHLPQPSEIWSYRPMPPFLASLFFLSKHFGAWLIHHGLFSMYKALSSIPTHTPSKEKQEKKTYFLVIPCLSVTPHKCQRVCFNNPSTGTLRLLFLHVDSLIPLPFPPILPPALHRDFLFLGFVTLEFFLWPALHHFHCFLSHMFVTTEVFFYQRHLNYELIILTSL